MRRWHSFFDFRISTHAPREGCDREMVIHSLVLSYFNSRTPCGVRHRSLPKVPPETYFNSRTQCGVRTRCSVSSAVVVSFQLTHPMRDTAHLMSPWGGRHFYCNSRTPYWVRLHGPVTICSPHFNSRTRTGCDAGCGAEPAGRVLTHAPREGCDIATAPSAPVNFNSRPRVGATCGGHRDVPKNRNYNSHTHAGCDHCPGCAILYSKTVYRIFQFSHPVRGATGR